MELNGRDETYSVFLNYRDCGVGLQGYYQSMAPAQNTGVVEHPLSTGLVRDPQEESSPLSKASEPVATTTQRLYQDICCRKIVRRLRRPYPDRRDQGHHRCPGLHVAFEPQDGILPQAVFRPGLSEHVCGRHKTHH